MRSIWRLLICVSLLFVTTLTVMGQSASDARNGYWWKSCTDGVKVGYVIGYVEGAQSSSMQWKMYNDISDKKMTQSTSNLAIRDEGFSGVKFGQYESGLDAFYQDFRNMSIHVEDAMPYVRDQIKGFDNNYLQTELNLIQKASTSPWIRQVNYG